MALDLQAVHRALNTLPQAQCKILLARLGSHRSERQVARDLGLSRYHLREACAEALAKLTVTLDERGQLSSRDWDLARCLWAEERSVSDIAEEFGITIADVRLSRQKTLRALHAALSVVDAPNGEARSKTMTTECSIWNALSRNPHDRQALEVLAPNPERLVEHLDECRLCAEQTANLDEEAWAEIYNLFGEDNGLSTSEEQALENMLEAVANDEKAVGAAVEQVLLPGLPAGMKDLSAIYPKIDAITLFLAIDSVPLLVHRIIEQEEETRKFDDILMNSDATLSFLTDGDKDLRLPAEVLLEQISYKTKLDLKAAGVLANWIWRAARSRKTLFIGLRAFPHGPRLVKLEPERRDPSANLFLRWRPEF
jgi:hypothetical protein